MQDDSVRAANGSQFKVSKQQLINLVEAYRTRTYIEDIEYLKDELNGSLGLQEALNVTLDSGTTAQSLEIREKVFGTNYKEGPQRTPFCQLLLAALDDFMLKILIVCAIFSIVVDMSFATPEQRAYAWIEGTAILFAVAVVSGVTAWSDYKKEGQFLKTQQMEENSKTVIIMRDHKETEMHRNYLKVGDIIKIVNGMNIPIDGVVLQGNGVMSDESAMTGESDHLAKETLEKCLQRQAEHEEGNVGKTNSHHDVPSPVLLSGTTIQTGQGWFICIVVGDMTCEGQIMASLDERPNEDTPLQQKLDVIAVDIGKLGMYAAILIVHVLLLRSFVEGMIRRDFDLFGGEKSSKTYYEKLPDGRDNIDKIRPCDNDKDECTGQFGQYIKEWLHYVIVGVAIIVVAVPEGLPLAVMISLAYSVQKMLADNNFVKRLSSCEIMGGANNICSDKTGTLTKNQMTWTQIWIGGDYEIPNPDGDPEDKFEVGQFGINNQQILNLFAQAVSCNTIGTNTDAQATELAMLKFIYRCNVDYHHQRQRYLPKEMLRFQFDSARKRMSTVVELEEGESTEYGYPKRIHVKGASEIVLGTCTHYLNSDGIKTVLDDQMSQQLDQIIKSYAKNALRTIAFAYKDLKEDDGGPNHENKADNSKLYDIELGDFTLICIAGIKDIIRDEVPGAVQQCNEAGVRVRMVTGDNKITAIAIAKECGIIYDGEEDEQCVCMEGPEFNEFVGGLKHKTTGEDIVVMGKEGS
jgi:Ca2+ transporting ATPase